MSSEIIDKYTARNKKNFRQQGEIAEQKLRLPTVFSQKWSIDRTIHELEKQCLPYVENWQNSHWLKGQLVLFLDEEMNGELMGFQLHYSFENGLEYWKATE